MALDYRPGMKIQVIWERDGKRNATHAPHASDKAAARSKAETYLRSIRSTILIAPGPRYGFV
jgi:hypothetical protein